MRVVRFTACLAALACSACAGQVAAPPPSPELLRVDNKTVGYYPGIAQSISLTPDLKAWLAENQHGIDDIQNRVVEIQQGRRTPGCIGQDEYTCVASLAQKFALTDSYLTKDANVFSQRRYDVNGKPLDSKIELYGFVPRGKPDDNPLQLHRATRFELTLGRHGLVSIVRARLAQDPTFAHTQDQYYATDAYETVVALTAKDCPTLDRAEVAKWIENVIKPNSKSYRGRVYGGRAAAKISKKMTFCGRTFQFESLWASRGYNQRRRDVNGGMFIAVE